MRDVEAGPDGVEYLAFGAGDDPTDAEMAQGWWSDWEGKIRVESRACRIPQPRRNRKL